MRRWLLGSLFAALAASGAFALETRPAASTPAKVEPAQPGTKSKPPIRSTVENEKAKLDEDRRQRRWDERMRRATRSLCDRC